MTLLAVCMEMCQRAIICRWEGSRSPSASSPEAIWARSCRTTCMYSGTGRSSSVVPLLVPSGAHCITFNIYGLHLCDGGKAAWLAK